MKKYLLNFPPNFGKTKKIILDIGFGNGESTIFLSQKYPDNIIIASDIYKDGIINLCRQLENKKIKNVKIFHQNIMILFGKKYLTNLIKEIWILFPDPWPKKKHYKRRLINSVFLKKLSLILNKNNKIYIATDSKSYFMSILNNFFIAKTFEWINDLPTKWDYSFTNYPKTKYFKKALINNKKPFIVIVKKI